MARMCVKTLILAVAVVLAAAGCDAAKLNIGDAAPPWSGVVGTDDKPHGLADCKDAKLVVLVFTCNHCPVAQAYQDRLIALQKDYRGKGVRIVAVNVSKNASDSLDAMKQRASEKEFNFPYLYDSTQKMGHEYGATVTPHVFVLDKDRKIAYMGAVDDNMKAEGVRTAYLRDAIGALLSGKVPPKTVTQQFGCGIQYESK